MVIDIFKSFFKHINLQKFLVWTKLFTPSQLCYFIAAFLLLFNLVYDLGIMQWVALIAFIGLTRELLNIFHLVWDNIIGKGVIIVLYASTANLALAFAALKINSITGIEPTSFVFTLGFTTLMLMPFWIALSSIIIFLVVLALANFWLLITILLKVLGFNISIHWEDKKQAVLTLFLRIVLIPLVLVFLVNVTLPFINDDAFDGAIMAEMGEEGVFLSINEMDDEAGIENINNQGEKYEPSPVVVSNGEAKKQELKESRQFIETIIANFIFYFESYPNSACLKLENQRSVMINEDLVLLISKNEEAEHGFDFEVQECVPRLKQ